MAESNLSVPRHVAIIMDGNGRWAAHHGLPRIEGHRQGAAAVEKALSAARKFGVKYLTLYAFSTENWKRSPQEISGLMNLLGDFLDSQIDNLMEHNVRLKTIGRTDDLPNPSRRKLLDCIEKTARNSSHTLTLALSYGGRAEITDAVKKIALEVQHGTIDVAAIDEKMIQKHLYFPDLPDPDLLIRTSGELRLSNFMLWQLSYSEIYATNVLWPDFDESEFAKAIDNYNCRERRFGGRKK